MPANIPSPIVGAGGGRQNPGQQLLLALAQQLMGGLLQRGMQKVMPQAEQPTQAEEQRTGLQTYAQQQLAQMPGTDEALALSAAAKTGLGNANVKTQDVAGLAALPNAASTAPERLALRMEKQKLADEEASKQRIRQRALKSTPANLRGVMEMMLNAKEAGADSSSINSLLPQLLPPTDAELIDQAHKQAQTQEIQLRLRQVKTDTKMRQELAGRIGLTSESVTDGMITEWMRNTADAAKASDPQGMAERLLTTLVSRSVVDPITGQANPAFSVEDAAARTEAGMQLFVPGFRLNLSTEQREIAAAAGVLRAAVARLKMSNPKIKEAEILEQLGPRFLQDFPNIPPDRFQTLLTEALKSNLLTGMGG